MRSQTDIFTSLPGAAPANVTRTDAREFDLAWSPSGDTIAFASASSDPLEFSAGIFVARSDGSGRTRLTGGPRTSDADPAWSPDGSSIAFARYGASAPDLFVMRADGSEPRQLTAIPGSEFEPAWSPDARRIAFVSFGPGDARVMISVMNADGTGLRKLVPGSEPAWSPNGKQIAYTRMNGSSSRIYVMDADGTRARPLLRRARR